VKRAALRCAIALVSVLIIAPGAAPAVAAPMSFTLESRERQLPGDLYAGPVSSPDVLLNGRRYLVVVTGTISLWKASQWTASGWTRCGRPDAAPAFPTPRLGNGPVGIDAEGRFAIVQNHGACPQLPYDPDHNFQMDLGRGFIDPEPIIGSLGPTHVYGYLVTGRGARLSVRFFDPAASDNYGRFRIYVAELPSP
jgi:hypothetical protein